MSPDLVGGRPSPSLVEPRTEAGRALVTRGWHDDAGFVVDFHAGNCVRNARSDWDERGEPDPGCDCDVLPAILAIEAESLHAAESTAALLTRQEALERVLSQITRTRPSGTLEHYIASSHGPESDCDICALLDASQPVKPPVLPEPDLRLMGEAVKGGKYPEQPVKP